MEINNSGDENSMIFRIVLCFESFSLRLNIYIGCYGTSFWNTENMQINREKFSCCAWFHDYYRVVYRFYRKSKGKEIIFGTNLFHYLDPQPSIAKWSYCSSYCSLCSWNFVSHLQVFSNFHTFLIVHCSSYFIER